MSATAERWRQPRRRAVGVVPGSAGRPDWVRRYRSALLAFDAAAALVGAELGRLVRFASEDASLSGGGADIPYAVITLIAVPLWLCSLGLGGGYSHSVLGAGSDEYRRVFNVAVRLLAAVAVVTFAAQVQLARGFVAVALPAITAFTLLGRYLARKWLHRQRAAGEWSYRVVVVGRTESTRALIRHLEAARYAGFTVLGVCNDGPAGDAFDVDDRTYPVLGPTASIEGAVRAVRADAVAVADSDTLRGDPLRRLAWSLEGTGVDLIVAPSLTNVAGPRIVTRPVAGLPMLHVEEPELSGPARAAKELVDRSLAGTLLLLLGPVLLVVGFAVKLTSPGPALFRQRRVGRHGVEFDIFKFRTMRAGADREVTDLRDLNEHDGVLFKIRDDPRRTPVGRFLRRWSIDELPQLWNVVTGHMSLVGPRPPLPEEVSRFADDARRRLLVKPGLTGLWQVSGRADLPWEEAVRLDLYYVENWSPALDVVILWKTIAAVLRGRGAY